MAKKTKSRHPLLIFITPGAYSYYIHKYLADDLANCLLKFRPLALFRSVHETHHLRPSIAHRPLRIMPMGGSIVEGHCDRPSQCTWPDDYKGPQGSKKVEACSATNKDEYPKAVGFRGFLRDGLTAAGVDMIYVCSVQVVEGLAHEGHSAFTIDNLDSITSRWMMCFTPVRSMTR